jgi:putative hydrolase of the HAD superfamily
MTPIRAVVSDFGGVLTSPLLNAFGAFQDDSGVSAAAIGAAMGAVAAADGRHPLFELEKGRMTEVAFLEKLTAALDAELGRPVALQGFGERLFAALEPNDALFAYYRDLRERGVRLAMLTNNVREWEQRWRSMLPIDDVFELVVDSAFVGMRKPEPEIYALTLERLELPADACAFVDDLEHNVDGARAAGMHGIHHRDTDSTIAELEQLLGA